MNPWSMERLAVEHRAALARARSAAAVRRALAGDPQQHRAGPPRLVQSVGMLLVRAGSRLLLPHDQGEVAAVASLAAAGRGGADPC